MTTSVPPVRRRESLIIHEYGCVECQRYHVQEIEPELYERHLYHQSKHGTRTRVATMGFATHSVKRG